MIHVQERPNTFDDVKGQKFVINNLRNQSIRNHFFNVMILCGKYGSGKTTMARIIALASNCEHKDEKGNPCLECESCKSILSQTNADVIEIDGATNNGVEAARKIKEEAGFIPMSGRKIIIIDECHKLTSAAWDALLKILEEPPEYMMFLLCTTDEKALPDTIRSRAPIYRFGAIEQDILEARAKEVAEKYDIKIDDDALYMLSTYADGSMRNMLSLLEQMSMQSEHIIIEDIRTLLGINDYHFTVDFIDNMLRDDLRACMMQIDDFVSKGRSIRLFSKDIIRCAVDMVIAKNGMTIKGGNSEYISKVVEVSERYSDERINALVSAVKTCMERVRDNSDSVDLYGSIIAVHNMLNDTKTYYAAVEKAAEANESPSKLQNNAEIKEKTAENNPDTQSLTTYQLPPLTVPASKSNPAKADILPSPPKVNNDSVQETELSETKTGTEQNTELPELKTSIEQGVKLPEIKKITEQEAKLPEQEKGSEQRAEFPELPKLNMFGIPLPEASFRKGLTPEIEEDEDTDECADEYYGYEEYEDEEYEESEYESASSGCGAGENDIKSGLHGLLDKATGKIKDFMASKSGKDNAKDYECQKSRKIDNEVFNRLSIEEKNKRYAWKEYNDLVNCSPLFAESIRQCHLTETDKGIVIGCPNEPIYNILNNLLADSFYLKAEYEP